MALPFLARRFVPELGVLDGEGPVLFLIGGHSLGHLPAGRRHRQTALSGLPELRRQAAAHVAHGVDDLVHGDLALDARQGHVRSGDGVHGAHDVALHAGHLHQTRHRVAHQTQHVLQGHGHRVAHLLRRAAPEGHQRPRRHGRGAAHLRLTAAGGAGDAGPVGDHRADAAGHVQGLEHGELRQLLPAVQGNQHRRQHSAGPRRGSRHDPAHTGVGFAHGQRLGNDLSGEFPADGAVPGGVLAHPRPLPAHQAAEAAALTGVGVGGVQHGPPGKGHLFDALVPGDHPVGHVGLHHDLPDGLALPADDSQQFLHGVQIHVSPPSRSR